MGVETEVQWNLFVKTTLSVEKKWSSLTGRVSREGPFAWNLVAKETFQQLKNGIFIHSRPFRGGLSRQV